MSAVEGVQAIDSRMVEQLLFFDPFDPEFREDPHRVYRAIRESGTVQRSPGGLWLVSGHEECSAILRDARFGWGEAQLAAGHFTTETDGTVVRPLTYTDPPDHTRIRSLVQSVFSARTVETLRPTAERMIGELVAGAAAADGPVDLIHAIAYPLAGGLLCELLGVDAAHQDDFRTWAAAMGRGLDPDFIQSPEQLRQREEAREQFHRYLTELAARRRVEPAADLVSGLVTAQRQGAQLSDTELIVTCTALLSAGYATTVHLIGNGMLALLRNPDQLAWFRAHPDQVGNVVEELLRYAGPLQLASRTPLEDTEIAGVSLGAGEPILLLVAAANRDPAVFADPDTLDLTRKPGRHLGFGLGIHFCIGAPLARLTAQAAFSMLGPHDLELASDRPRRAETLVLHGLDELPVHFR